MYLHIKNMVCVRCILAVKAVLGSLAITYQQVELGRVELNEELTVAGLHQFSTALRHYELELMENPKKILVEQIKLAIIEMFHSPADQVILKLSAYLSHKLQYDYTYMANIFSAEEGNTIEKFYILTKVKRIKEMLVYEGLTIKEISFQLNYSSVAHLSLQFKKFTGITPAVFKRLWQTQQVSL